MNAKSVPLPTPEDLATERLVVAVESAIDTIQKRLANLAADSPEAKWSLSDLARWVDNPRATKTNNQPEYQGA